MKLALSTRCEISTGTQEWCEGKGTDFCSGILLIAMAVVDNFKIDNFIVKSTPTRKVMYIFPQKILS
jgi:hypothetical protein